MDHLPLVAWLLMMVLDFFIYIQVDTAERASVWKKTLLWLLFFAALLATFIVPLVVANFTGSGELQRAIFVETPQGERLVVASRVDLGYGAKSSTSYRLRSIDLTTGTQVVSHSFRWTDYLTTSAGLIWLYNDSLGLHARSSETLALVVDQKTILKNNPELAQGISVERFYLDPVSHGPVITAKNGYSYAIDPKTFKATSISAADLGKMEYFVPGTKPDNRTPALLNGEHLEDVLTDKPIELDGPPSVLVLHTKDVDDKTPDFLTRVTPEGKILWETRIIPESTNGLSVEEARYLNGTLFFITEQTLTALNPADGSITWTIDF